MLIAVDIGNTNIVLGFIEDEQVAATYRITTKSNHTSDEFGIMMLQFLQLKGFAPRDVHDVIITSVVPKVMHSFTAAIVKFLGITPMVVGPGIRTAAEALTSMTAQLPEVEIRRPTSILAKDTKNAIQAGLYYDFLGGIERIITQFHREIPEDFQIVATGGLARILDTPLIDVVDPDLIFKGMLWIYRKNI